MRDHGAVVSPAVDIKSIAKEVRQRNIARKDAEAAEEAAGKAFEQRREEAARARLELGRVLIQARKAWPARGPGRVNGKTWSEWLADQGIEEQSAREWMNLAGYVAEVSKPSGDGLETPDRVPTRREVQEARREKSPAPRVTREIMDDCPPDDVPDVEPGDDGEEDEPREVDEAPQPQPEPEPAPPEPARDALGRALPTPVAAAFAIITPRLERIAAMFAEAAKEWGAMVDETTKAGIQNATRPMWTEARTLELSRLSKIIADSTPYALCVSCEGKNPKDYCAACGGAGWMKRTDYDQALPELKGKALAS